MCKIARKGICTYSDAYDEHPNEQSTLRAATIVPSAKKKMASTATIVVPPEGSIVLTPVVTMAESLTYSGMLDLSAASVMNEACARSIALPHQRVVYENQCAATNNGVLQPKTTPTANEAPTNADPTTVLGHKM